MAHRDRRTLLLAGAIVSGGFVPLSTLPFVVVGITSGLHVDASAAGLLGTGELGGVVLGSLAVTPFLRDRSRATLAILALLAGLGFELVSCLIDSVTYLLPVRILVGIACGVALGAGNAIAARVSDPSKFYMRVLAFESAVTTVSWTIMPACLRLGDQKGVFLAAGAVLLTLLIVIVATRSAEEPVRPGASTLPATTALAINPLDAAIALAAMLFCCVRDGLAWTFADQIGTDVGLTSGERTLLWGAIGFLGLFGLVVSARLTGRRHPILSVAASVAIASSVTTGLLYVTTAPAYVVLALPWTAVQFIAVSYLTGLAAQIDSSGRIAAASGAFFQFGYALAPFLAGLVMAHFGHRSVGLLSTILTLFTIGTGVWAAGRILKYSAATSAVQQGLATSVE
jgi:predicted MFS family arabinose efflux permease